MKKLLIIAMLFMVACKAKQYTLGMSEKEFLANNHKAKLVKMRPDYTVYRITKDVMTSDPGTKYYYFAKGQLFLIDEGVQRPDLTIDQTIHNQ